MNKVEKVSIGGFAFTMDDDACRMAGQYIDELSKHYSDTEGGSDILEGIEERLAELLIERCGQDGVVSSTMVTEVIGILGRPEAIDSESDTESSSGDAAPKRLYRDLSDRMISGVCSGLGAYTGVDTALFRLAFVALTVICFLLSRGDTMWAWCFPLIYCALWICMPGAKTVQQRYAMRGEDISLEGVKKSVQEGAVEIGDAARRIGKSTIWPTLWRVLAVFAGLILLITGVGGLTAGTAGIIGYNMPGFSAMRARIIDDISITIPDLADMVTSPWIVGMFLAVVFIPLLAMLYEGLHLVLGFKSPKWHPGLCLLILWLICSIALGVLLAMGGAAETVQWWA